MITDPRLSVIFPKKAGTVPILSVAGRIDGLAAGKARVEISDCEVLVYPESVASEAADPLLRHTVDLETRAKLVAFDVVKLAEIDAALPDGGQVRVCPLVDRLATADTNETVVPE